MNGTTMKTPVGGLLICEDGNGICGVYFGNVLPDEAVREETPLLKEAVKQLNEYFAGERREFTLPLSMEGTAFQKRVWEALCAIPYGETRTYGQIAAQIENPGGSRAVGMANHNNPVAIIVPCHRVVGAGGKLTGYAGGLGIKRALLELEGISC